MLFRTPGLQSLAVLLSLSFAGLGGIIGPALAETITIVGTLTQDGVECPAMSGDDGKLYTLSPKDKVGLAAAGMRIRVEGTIAEMSMCQQGITIEVTKVEPAE